MVARRGWKPSSDRDDRAAAYLSALFCRPAPGEYADPSSDLTAALTAQMPEADRVAQALDLYVSGSLNFF